MTVSAAAAFAMMTAAFAFAMMTAALTFTVMSAAATALTTASQVLDQVLYLLVSSLAVFLDLTCEVQSFASQRVVGVHRDAVGLYLHDLRHEVVIVVVGEGDDGPLIDIIAVELAVDGEDLASELVLSLWHIVAEGLCRLQGEVEAVALGVLHEFLLETVEGYAEAGDKLKRALVASLLLQLLAAILSDGVKLIYDRNESVFWFLHTLLYIY